MMVEEYLTIAGAGNFVRQMRYHLANSPSLSLTDRRLSDQRRRGVLFPGEGNKL